MRVIIASSVEWLDAEKIRNELIKLPLGATVVYGAVTGSSCLVPKIATELRLDLEEWPAETDVVGFRADTLRNQKMIASDVDLCLAFPIGDCRGTWDCIKRARGAHIETIVVR